MGRRGAFRNQRIDDKICKGLEQMMASEHRRGSLNAYVEEILDKWVSGLITENKSSKTVHRIGPIKGVNESDEGKRKAS